MLFRKPVHPKPSLTWWSKKEQKQLPNCTLSFKVPKLRGSIDKLVNEPTDAGTSSSLLPVCVPHGYSGLLKGLSFISAYSGSWDLKWPQLIGTKHGHIIFRARIITVESMPANDSFFKADSLFDAIKSDIQHRQVTETHCAPPPDNCLNTDEQWPTYLSPINMQWTSHAATNWIYYEVQDLWQGGDIHIWSTPVGHNAILELSFSACISVFNAGNAYRKYERVSSDPFRKLMLQIMDTVELELSPEALQEQARHPALNEQTLPRVLRPSDREIAEAAMILREWSCAGYDSGRRFDDNIASKAAIEHFLHDRLRARALPGLIRDENAHFNTNIASL
jgi:hypothetical protein